MDPPKITIKWKANYGDISVYLSAHQIRSHHPRVPQLSCIGPKSRVQMKPLLVILPAFAVISRKEITTSLEGVSFYFTFFPQNVLQQHICKIIDSN